MAIKLASKGALLALLRSPEHQRAVAMVRNERAHQLDLAFSPAHDDCHKEGELAYAGLAYLWEYVDPGGRPAGRAWPWSGEDAGKFRSKGCAVANLTAAIALQLAELERLIRFSDASVAAGGARSHAFDEAALLGFGDGVREGLEGVGDLPCGPPPESADEVIEGRAA